MSFCISLSLSISLHFPPFLFLAPFLSSYPLCRLPTSALSDAPITLPLLSTSPSCTFLDSLSSFSASFHFHSSCSISLPNSFPLSPIPDLFAPSFPPFLPPFFLFFLPRATSPLCLSPHFSSFLSPFSLSDLGLLFFRTALSLSFFLLSLTFPLSSFPLFCPLLHPVTSFSLLSVFSPSLSPESLFLPSFLLPSTPSLPTLLSSFLFLSSSFISLHFSPFYLLPSLFRPFHPFSPPYLLLSSLLLIPRSLCSFPIPLPFLHLHFFPFSCPSLSSSGICFPVPLPFGIFIRYYVITRA